MISETGPVSILMTAPERSIRVTGPAGLCTERANFLGMITPDMRENESMGSSPEKVSSKDPQENSTLEIGCKASITDRESWSCQTKMHTSEIFDSGSTKVMGACLFLNPGRPTPVCSKTVKR